MGFDLYGERPKNETGEYFRRSVWGWRPLAHLVLDLCPDETLNCEYWHSNDGDGLDEDDALALAEKLEIHLRSGRVDRWIKKRDEWAANLPRQICTICNGTGIRTDAIGVSAGWTEKVIDEPGHPRHGQKGSCNGCGGHGTVPDFETHYRVERVDVVEFVEFLKGSGGFEIC